MYNSEKYFLGSQVQNYLHSIAFLVICIFGVVVSFIPSTFKSTHISGSNLMYNENLIIKGHHPDCPEFIGHTLNIFGKWYCAGCTGLGIGGMIAIVLTGSYILGVGIVNPLSLFWTGIVFVVLGLGQHYIDCGNPVFHLLLNVVFVLGATFLHISVDFLQGGFQINSYFIFLVLFWIITRIEVSKSFHRRICEECGIGCMVSFKG
jgi:hypothetical protein